MEFEEAIKAAQENGISDEKYQAFVDKFKPKLTTDDCFTPPPVYEAVKEWALKEYGWEGRPIVRPFYPGGDYENYDYPENCVVIDNPPFSIFSQIVGFYEDRHIDYFLFAQAKTILGVRRATSRVVASAEVEYDNGARIDHSFVSSKGPLIMTAPKLAQAVEAASEEYSKAKRVHLPKVAYPANVINFAVLNLLAENEQEIRIEDAVFVRRIDAQKKDGKAIYGGGTSYQTV